MKTIEKEELEKIVKLFNEGFNINEIGRIVGRHHGVISYRLAKEGIRINPETRGNRNKTSTETIKEMYLSGKSTVQIAKETGFKSAQGVHDRLVKNGVKIRDLKEALKISHIYANRLMPKGENHHAWKGGIWTNNTGYRQFSLNGKKHLEHIFIWEQQNGFLPKGWVIHHLNGIKDDNRIENLQAMPRRHHSPIKIIEPFRQRIRELEKELKKYL
jgi:hypothetical protein